MRNRIQPLFAAAALFAVSAFAQSGPTVEERLQALELQVQNLSRENAELKKQLVGRSVPAPVSVVPSGKESKLTIGGFLQGQAEFGGASDSRWNGIRDRFFFRRARIYVAGSLAEDFDYKAEIDLQGNTLGAGTGQLARANEIYVGWHKYPFASLRFGQLKPAFGAEALASDTKIPTIERSLASDRLTDSRQLAVSVSGDLTDKTLGYTAVIANGNGSNVSANDNSKFQKSARITFTPPLSAGDKIVLGIDGLWTDDMNVSKSDFGFAGNLFAGRRQMWGVDALWTRGRWDLSGEYLHGNFQPQRAVRFDADGWHVTAAFFLIPSKLQAVFRHEEFDSNTRVAGNTARSDLIGLSYFIRGDDLKLMLNYVDGAGPVNSGDRLLTRVQLIF